MTEITTSVKDLLPGRCFFLTDGLDALRLASISETDDDRWKITLTKADDETELVLVTPYPCTWLPSWQDVGHGLWPLALGDVVRRGRGKLLWRVTGLSASLVDRPVVELLSMPEPTAKGAAGMALSAQTFGVVGSEAIATLVKADIVGMLAKGRSPAMVASRARKPIEAVRHVADAHQELLKASGVSPDQVAAAIGDSDTIEQLLTRASKIDRARIKSRVERIRSEVAALREAVDSQGDRAAIEAEIHKHQTAVAKLRAKLRATG